MLLEPCSRLTLGTRCAATRKLGKVLSIRLIRPKSRVFHSSKPQTQMWENPEGGLSEIEVNVLP